MRRLHGAFTALTLALAAPAGAAEISRVVSSGEPRAPFSMDLDVRWDRSVESATITREKSSAATSTIPGGVVFQGDRLAYKRTRNAVVPRLAVGLWKDFEAHFEMPYVLGDDREWRYGSQYGNPTGPENSSIANNTIDAQGQPCSPSPCPLFPVPSTGYHGGKVGDLKAGLAWAIFNDRKDDTKPTWVLGMDLTAPTAAKWAPGMDRTPDTWESPYGVKANPGPFGEKIWKWDLYTVLSKRYRYVDPYLKAHAQFAFRSAATYSNCDAVKAATAPTLLAQQMNSDAMANCASFGDDAGAQLPFVAGLTFGTEIVPYEDAREGQKVTLDFRLYGEATSKARFYNELSDATGKILQTGQYLEVGGLAGLYLRASKYVQLKAQASLATRTAHDLTGEALGRNGSTPALDPSGNGRTLDPTQMNPNFDWRWDAPGRRFRISEVSLFELSFGALIMF
jgi:hypothetical protein